MNGEEFRYLIKEGKHCCTYFTSFEDLENGEFKKRIGKGRIVKRDKLLKALDYKDIYENDLILLTTQSDSGMHSYVVLANAKNIQINRNIGGKGGNAYSIVKDIKKVDWINSECEVIDWRMLEIKLKDIGKEIEQTAKLANISMPTYQGKKITDYIIDKFILKIHE